MLVIIWCYMSSRPPREMKKFCLLLFQLFACLSHKLMVALWSPGKSPCTVISYSFCCTSQLIDDPSGVFLSVICYWISPVSELTPSLYNFKVRDKSIIMVHNSLFWGNNLVFRDAELALGHHCFRNCFGRQMQVEVNIPLSLLNMCFFISQYFLCFSDIAQAF